jgi:hypothetical protein
MPLTNPSLFKAGRSLYDFILVLQRLPLLVELLRGASFLIRVLDDQHGSELAFPHKIKGNHDILFDVAV